jgi:hypothetical protein
MSDTPKNETTTDAPKKTPLQLVKERQAAMQANRSSKGSKSGQVVDKEGGVSEAPTAKPMRSSASKQGG